MEPHRFTYVPELDGVRAIAVSLVVLTHAGIPGAAAGFFGVDVFFVMSGYLITRILRAEIASSGNINLLGFYGRRLRRLSPPLFLLLVIYLMAAPWAFPSAPMSKHATDAAIGAFYLWDYAHEFGVTPVALGHLWSLSVEEHFYLIWPAVLILASRMSQRHAVMMLAGLLIAVTAWRAYGLFSWANYRQLYFRFDFHSSGLILGGLIGYVRPNLPPIVGWAGLGGLLLCVAAFAPDTEATVYLGFSLVELCAAAIVLSPPPFLAHPALTWLGRRSYGIYLWQTPLIYFVALQGGGSVAQLAVGGGAAVGAAALSYRWVEARFTTGGRHLSTVKPS